MTTPIVRTMVIVIVATLSMIEPATTQLSFMPVVVDKYIYAKDVLKIPLDGTRFH